MSFELPGRITGLQAHQKTPDIPHQLSSGETTKSPPGLERPSSGQLVRDKPANVNSTASESDRITFSELLSNTIEKMSQPTPDNSQGNIIHTGNPLDLAIDGVGYFVLSDGQQNIYTRSGAFAVDANSNLIDPVTGSCLQRIGSEGESNGFQTPGDSNVRIPYNASMPANKTSAIQVSGNLSGDATLADGPQIQQITSNMAYTTNGGTVATTATEIGRLDQFSGGPGTDGELAAGESGTLTISGYNPDGTAFSSGQTFTFNPTTTLGEVIRHLNNNVLSGAAASLVNGKIQITDACRGYSRTDIRLSTSGNGSLTTPGYFEISTVGGKEVKNVGITIYDSQGGKHVLSGAFVRTNTPNTWDMVLSSVSGNVRETRLADRRIENISFNASDGSYAGLSGPDLPQFVITFVDDTAKPQTIEIQMGTVGKLDGLTQFNGSSTAAASEQDGYEAGRLSTVSVNKEGIISGAFTNGIKKNIATLQAALFENTSGLKNIGSGYFIPSDSSGQAAAGTMTGAAGTIHGGALQKSNADVATEFVNMLGAQNGFQANARTIRAANEILHELSNLIR
ncbi:MAG TPA: flagellar hook-basal body complex protein [Planctomycetes bacterium]|nr:flagellar hook-basal body complex protein [Planctomycetota bacterium]